MKTVVRPETEMKNSGIEYIGKIPNDWEVRKAGYLGAKITDYVASGSFATLAQNVQYLDEPDYARLIRTVDLSGSVNKQPVYVSKEAYKFLSNSNLFGGELILPNIGSVGCVYQYKKIYEHATLAPNSILLDMKENNRFYFYWFSNPIVGESLKMLGNSTVQVKFNKSQLRQYMLPRPPLSEQQAIADYLDETCSKIDEIIAEAKASIDEYKELKQSVIFEAVTKGLDKNVEMKAVNLEYLDSCPMDWNILPVSILFDFWGGFAYKSDRFCEETNNQVVRLGNVKDDELRLNSNPVYVSDEYADDSSKAAIKVDDILFTMTGTRGKGDYFYTLIITEDDLKEKNLFLNQRVGCFRKAYHTVYMPYYNYLLKSPKIRERVFLYETGTANQGNIGIENINRIRLYNPPMKVQKNIVRMLNQKCNTIDSLITEKESLINDLEAYKKSLIYEVVTGKRRVV